MGLEFPNDANDKLSGCKQGAPWLDRFPDQKAPATPLHLTIAFRSMWPLLFLTPQPLTASIKFCVVPPIMSKVLNGVPTTGTKILNRLLPFRSRARAHALASAYCEL